MSELPAYKILPLGDTALVIDFGNIVSHSLNDRIISLFKNLQKNPLEFMTEAVPAYSSLAVYYDIVRARKKIPEEKTVFDWMKNEVRQFLENEKTDTVFEKRVVKIPVCYEKEFATDMDWISEKLKLSPEEVIQLHTSKSYRVYMLGFLPGFAYLGEVDDKIVLPRKPQPQHVIAGSVGIAGKQTGVYPFDSPGGWQIIGRSPLKFFNKEKKEPTLVNAGDTIEFFSITKDEFNDIKRRNA